MDGHAAVGLREHTGWAAAVTLAGPVEAPALVDRRRLTLLDGDLPAHLYHAAQALTRPDAERLVAEGRSAAFADGERAVADAVEELRAAGLLLVAVAVSVSKPPPASLDRILSSHALLHTAEGELFREVLAAGAERCGLPVVRVAPKTVIADVADAAGMASQAVVAHLAALGRAAGPPWREDQRLAAAAAWLALLATESSR
jgi:hypothetical protein